MPKDKSDEEPLRVTDRRRFTETGDERSDAEAHPPPPEEPVRTAPPEQRGRVETGARGGNGSQGGRPLVGDDDPGTGLPPPDVAVNEMGVQAVFYILWQSALLALGTPDQSGRSMPVDLAEARQAIALLKILQEKTRGNLSAEEEATLKQLLHDSQLRYVQAAGTGGRS